MRIIARFKEWCVTFRATKRSVLLRRCWLDLKGLRFIGQIGNSHKWSDPGRKMAVAKKMDFDPGSFLSAVGLARKAVKVKPKHSFYSQGSPANSVFYLESGRAKLTVVSKRGKEATVTLLAPGDFIGEEALAGAAGSHTATAVAITACIALKIDREEMVRLLHEKHEFSDLFLKFILMRGMRTQEDLVDQLFNNSEKRLARTLLLMAEFGKPGEPETMIPPITQEALADLIGTTRSRVSYFMNRFRKMGFITYNGRIHVHKSLLNVVLHDRLPEQNAKRPVILDPERTPAQKAKQHKVA
jgi:CRP/FNR family cyclic AMP-dependent transcriptional regulator